MKKITKWVKILLIPAFFAAAAFVFLAPKVDQKSQTANASYSQGDSNRTMRHQYFRRTYSNNNYYASNYNNYYSPNTSGNMMDMTSRNYNCNISSANTVSISRNAFVPNTITVNPNTTVTWTNNDSVVHTVTSNNGSFNSGSLRPGKSFQVHFPFSGTYAYHCTIHPNMTGTVVVRSTYQSGNTYQHYGSNFSQNQYIAPTSYYSPYSYQQHYDGSSYAPYDHNYNYSSGSSYIPYDHNYNYGSGSSYVPYDHNYNYGNVSSSQCYSGNYHYQNYYNNSNIDTSARSYSHYSPSTGTTTLVIIP